MGYTLLGDTSGLVVLSSGTLCCCLSSFIQVAFFALTFTAFPGDSERSLPPDHTYTHTLFPTLSHCCCLFLTLPLPTPARHTYPVALHWPPLDVEPGGGVDCGEGLLAQRLYA